MARTSQRGRHRRRRRRELTFLSDELGPPSRGPAALTLQEGVGLRADWLGRPHLPRWASKFVSISDLQPHRCLHPITKQYLATSACAREPVQDRAREQVGSQSCLVSQRPTYRCRLAPTSLSRRVEVPEQSTLHVALPLCLPPLSTAMSHSLGQRGATSRRPSPSGGTRLHDAFSWAGIP